MKKRLKYSSLLLMAFALILIGCEKETEGISKVTKFAEFEMTGPEYYFLEKGTPFSEPGIKATEGGEEIPVTTEGSVDETTKGIYILSYSAKNSDGFEKTVTRIVIVYEGDLTATDLTGNYAGGYYGDATMSVSKVKDGLYQSTDVFGYGPPYEISGKIADLGNGDLIVLPTSSAFGPVLKSEGIYTSTTLEYTLGIEGYGYIFDTVWTKQ
ncbi:MAG: DUF5011 domain-containing protein [Bacteroidales bacterium]|nr:DUF5011 domain-containing protein [Bacteroidales bacterium]MCF8327044.1 DUF5011 domain-containing protein [Bacteroidales bacterium]